MNELYRTSETGDSAVAADTSALADAGSHGYEDPGRSDGPIQHEEALEGEDYVGYDEGGTLAAEEEGLATRQEAWEQTWGAGPEHYDDNEPGAYYDGDASTLAVEEEGLPTRQEAWEQTWGDAGAEQTSDAQNTPDVALSEGDQIPEPRSEQEVTEECTAGDSDTGDQDAADAADVSDNPVGGRPDIVARYPDDYVRSPEPPPDVTKTHEHPETWVDEINAPGVDKAGRDNNCGECSRAVDNTWSGHPATAAALADRNAGGEPVERMAEWAGTSPVPATMTEIGQRLRDLGPGSSAIVGCDWKDDPGGHWFNAVNDGGTVKAIDGQRARAEAWPPSNAGFGFDESIIRYSDAIFFAADGKVVKDDHA